METNDVNLEAFKCYQSINHNGAEVLAFHHAPSTKQPSGAKLTWKVGMAVIHVKQNDAVIFIPLTNVQWMKPLK